MQVARGRAEGPNRAMTEGPVRDAVTRHGGSDPRTAAATPGGPSDLGIAAAIVPPGRAKGRPDGVAVTERVVLTPLGSDRPAAGGSRIKSSGDLGVSVVAATDLLTTVARRVSAGRRVGRRAGRVTRVPVGLPEVARAGPTAGPTVGPGIAGGGPAVRVVAADLAAPAVAVTATTVAHDGGTPRPSAEEDRDLLPSRRAAPSPQSAKASPGTRSTAR